MATAAEKKAASRQKSLGKHNAKTVINQLKQDLANYDLADAQNKALAETESQQARRKSSRERFQAQRDLRNSALGVLGSMGSALNGSNTENFIDMLEDRVDNDNVNYWGQKQDNLDTIWNAYNESLNQNVLNRREAYANAIASLQGIRGDVSANLSNIGTGYKSPGNIDLGPGTSTSGLQKKLDKQAGNYAQLSGYMMPDNARTNARNIAQPNTTSSNSYTGRLLNRYNGGY